MTHLPLPTAPISSVVALSRDTACCLAVSPCYAESGRSGGIRCYARPCYCDIIQIRLAVHLSAADPPQFVGCVYSPIFGEVAAWVPREEPDQLSSAVSTRYVASHATADHSMKCGRTASTGFAATIE
jgi:hypothetical protein